MSLDHTHTDADEPHQIPTTTSHIKNLVNRQTSTIMDYHMISILWLEWTCKCSIFFTSNEITLLQVSASKPEKAFHGITMHIFTCYAGNILQCNAAYLNPTICKNMKTFCSASETKQMRKIKTLIVSIV